MGVAPLPHEYMIVGVIGFFISIFMINNLTWSFALGLFCLLLIIASLVSISGPDADVDTIQVKK